MSTDDAAPASSTDPRQAVGAGAPAGPSQEDRVLGCLLGSMAGDAYGVLAAVGDDPSAALGHPGDLAVSDATQLTLYTVDGLVDALEWANDGVAADETACLWLAYLRWLRRQGEHLPAGAPAPPGRWLDAQEELLPVHEPDGDTVRALLTGEMGTRSRPVNPGAEGPGALMRSAPFGLVPRIPASMVERLTVDAAALTHGSAVARGTAALYSGIIRALAIDGLGLADAVRRTCGEEQDPAPTYGGTTAAGRAGGTTAAGTFEAALQSVRGADEATPVQGRLAGALARAASTDRPDASPTVAASLAGGMIGALHGTRALPAAYLDAPGVPAVVRGMARALLKVTTGS